MTMFPSFAKDLVSPPTLIGRDEMNLAEFPLALLTDTVKAGQKTLYFEDSHGRLTVTGSDAYGLPTAIDADVIVALLYLTKKRNDFTDAKVNFSKYELIKLLNWDEHGESYKRLDQSLRRWCGVMLVYDKCWWDNKIKKYVSAMMHIIENVVVAEGEGKRRDTQTDLTFSSFTWNQTFIESCQADNLRQIDLDMYFKLKNSVAKRLYRFLGKRFWVKSDWTFDLNEIAFDRVGLSRSYKGNAGKIKEKLQPAIDKLEAVGFLRPLSQDERYHRLDRGKWTIRLAEQPPALAAVKKAEEVAAAASPLLADLISRGVTKLSAADLIERHQADLIARKIQVFDWMLAKQDKRLAKSPAGYLVTSINRQYVDPKGFESAAARAAKAEAKRVADAEQAEQTLQKRSRRAAEDAEARRVNDYWKSLSIEQQASLQELADAQADPADLAAENRHHKSFGQAIRRKEFIQQLLRHQQPEPA